MPLRTRIEIGIVNNMPYAALVPTERQFSGLIEQASGDLDINISLYAQIVTASAGHSVGDRPNLSPRARSARSFSRRADSNPAPSRTHRTFATNPIGANSPGSPHGRNRTRSRVFSCLAAHAEVLRRDKIVRRRQPIKLPEFSRPRLSLRMGSLRVSAREPPSRIRGTTAWTKVNLPPKAMSRSRARMRAASTCSFGRGKPLGLPAGSSRI